MPKTNEVLLEILNLLRVKTNVDLSEYKLTTINRRVERQMKIHKVENQVAYAQFLKAKPDAIKELYDEIFIHVTEFFRDVESFDALKDDVLSKLFKTRAPGVPFRIWVPGCSTGEEAYSLAMILLELSAAKSENPAFQIFATDISERAIEKGRSGFYEQSEVSGVSQARLKQHFEPAQGGYKINRNLRDHCVFSRHDLTRNPPFAKIDLISCRNVLIYFGPELQKQVMPMFHYALNPNGFLWLGRSESPGSISKLFTLLDKTNKIFSKINGGTSTKFRFPSTRVIDKIDASKKAHNPSSSVHDQQKEIDRIAASKYAPAGVVCNSDMEVLQVRGQTASFLELPGGKLTHNILKMIRPELLPALRFTFQHAQKTNGPSRKEGLTYKAANGRKKINLEVIPVNPEATLKDRQYLVFFEQPDQKKEKSSLKNKSAKKKATVKKAPRDSYITELLQELDSLRDHHHSIAEGYETTQEELTSANEELQSTLEEFQSTNEELETAKEELQAANEELTTLNDELQGRNEELISLNEKLLESESRFRLMVEGVKDYAIFMLDPEGKIVSWNEGAKRLKLYEADEIIGRHFSKFYLAEDIKNQKPQKELETALASGRIEDEGWRVRKDGSKFWANVIITKVENEKGDHLGFSKVTRDLSERKYNEERLKQANESLEIRVKKRNAELLAALQIREEFLSIASHELKTPLTSLRLQIQMALRRLNAFSPQQVLDAFEMCLKQTDALVVLVEDLLDVSRAQTGRFKLTCEDLDLSNLTRDVLKRLSNQLTAAGVSLELRLQDRLIGHWDRQRLEQVITNLVSNVVKYAPKKSLVVTTELRHQKAVLVVQDSGPGIDAANQKKIFERFERANQSKNSGGLGLGLFIVREILVAHGGSISVESTLGKGTTFCVELPFQSCVDEADGSK